MQRWIFGDIEVEVQRYYVGMENGYYDTNNKQTYPVKMNKYCRPFIYTDGFAGKKMTLLKPNDYIIIRTGKIFVMPAQWFLQRYRKI